MKFVVIILIVSFFEVSCRHNSAKKSDPSPINQVDIDTKIKTAWWKDHEQGAQFVQNLKELNRTDDAALAESKLQVEIQRSFKESELKMSIERNECFKSHAKEKELLDSHFSNRSEIFDSCLIDSKSAIENITCFNNYNEEIAKKIETMFVVANCVAP